LPINPDLAARSPDVLASLLKEIHLLAALEHVNIGVSNNYFINIFVCSEVLWLLV
jgi:hypothetical protein